MQRDLDELRNEKLMKNILRDAADCLSESLLETCADQEYRICLLELGITE